MDTADNQVPCHGLLTMMMATFQHQQQQDDRFSADTSSDSFDERNNNGKRNHQDGNGAPAHPQQHHPNKKQQIDSLTAQESPRATIDAYGAGYANPPLVPADTKNKVENPSAAATTIEALHLTRPTIHQQDQPQQQPAAYISRTKRAAIEVKNTTPDTDNNLLFSEAFSIAAARRELRMSYIKSAAKAINESSATASATAEATDAEAFTSRRAGAAEAVMPALGNAQQMPAFPFLDATAATRSSNNVEGKGAGQAAASTANTGMSNPRKNEGSTKEKRSGKQAGVPHVSPPMMGTPPSHGLSPPAMPLEKSHNSPAGSGKRSGGEASGSHSNSGSASRGIPHVYHDFASVPDATGYIRKKTGGVTQPFPEKLHELLEQETTADFHTNVNGIVGWLPHGRAFLVRKPKEFTQDVMPK